MTHKGFFLHVLTTIISERLLQHFKKRIVCLDATASVQFGEDTVGFVWRISKIVLQV